MRQRFGRQRVQICITRWVITFRFHPTAGKARTDMFPERLRPVEFKNDSLNGVHSHLRGENSIPKTLLQRLRAPSKLPRRVTHRTKALLLLYMFKATTGRHFTSGKSRRHDNDDAAIRPSRDQNRVRDFSRIWVRGYHGDCHAYH